MKLKELTKEELETMSYDEIAYLILEESGKKMKLIDIFKRICNILDLDVESFIDHISDFFELLSINKKFIMLDNGYWDLQTKHKPEIIIEDAEDEEPIEADDDVDDTSEDDDEKEDIFYEGDETDDVEEDDLADLVVVDDEEETSN